MNKQIIAVSGNVGSGKTTLLKELHGKDADNSVLILEPLDEWAPFLEAFKASGSPEDQLALQREVSKFAKTTWETITKNPDKNIFIERTTREHIDIFLDKERLGAEVYLELVEFYNKWNYDNLLTKVIKLEVPAEECFVRLAKRGQPGDEGTTLEYLKFLEERYTSHFAKFRESSLGDLEDVTLGDLSAGISAESIFPVCKATPEISSLVFSGNIGAGKTTAINKVKSWLEADGIPVVTFRERLDLWGHHLQRFRETRTPEDLVVLQKAIAECAESVYTALSSAVETPGGVASPVFLIERSVRENIVVFIDPHLHSGFLSQEQYDEIVAVWNKWNYDPLTSAVGYLDASPQVCFDRVVSRGQEGDKGITLDYLEGLGEIYSSFIKEKVYHEVAHGIPILSKIENLKVIAPSKVIVFTGNIGSGKSTAIKKLSAQFGNKAKAILEPVEEWGEDLSAFKASGSVEDMLRLQKNIASFSKTVYAELLNASSEYYFIERSNHEHLKIFCEPLLETKFLTDEQYADVTSDYRNYNFDKLVTDVVFLDVPHEECYRRVSSRGQSGDDSVDPKYLEYLGGRYSTLYEGKEMSPGFLGEFLRVKL